MSTGYRRKFTTEIYCRACWEAKYGGVSNLQILNDSAFHRCGNCGRDASYPLWRDYKLYELDDSNCRRITGYGYEELRNHASDFFGPGPQSQNSPLWDAVLKLDAHDVWDWRQKIGGWLERTLGCSAEDALMSINMGSAS